MECLFLHSLFVLFQQSRKKVGLSILFGQGYRLCLWSTCLLRMVKTCDTTNYGLQKGDTIFLLNKTKPKVQKHFTVYSSFLFIYPCLGSSTWSNTGNSVGVKHKPLENQTNKSSAYSNRSSAVPNLSAHRNNASSSHIPTVCFDLGDEWDDWGDFDDENLVNASEMPYQTNTVPTVQQSVNYSVTGRVIPYFRYDHEGL